MADLPQPVTRLADAGPAWMQAHWLKRLLTVADPLSIAALFVFRLSHSWMRWGDPLVDFPRSLYAAWRLSVGDRLYDDVVSEYGPLAHLVQAAGFRIFGVGLDTMVWMNTALAVGVVVLLRAIFRTLGSKWMGWLAPMVFISVFAFENYYLVSNYNFITPYSAQATYGFAGMLLLLLGLLRCVKTERRIWLLAAGIGLAVVFLDKPDLLLASLGALAVFLVAQVIQRARSGSVRTSWQWLLVAALPLAAGFIALWLPTFIFFMVEGGPAYALYATDHVVYTVTSATVLNNVEKSPLMLQIFGFIDPWSNVEDEINSACLMVVPCLVMAWAAQKWTRARAGSAVWAMAVLVVVAPLLWVLAHLSRDNLWLDCGQAFAFPVLLATAGYGAWCLWAAWRDRAEFPRVLSLTVVGVAASLMLVRMILNIKLAHFGFFMMPLAVLFWIHLIVVEAATPASESRRVNWLLPAVFSAMVLLVSSELARNSFDNYELKTYEVGSGRDRFYTYPPTIYPNGWLLKTMVEGAKVVAPHAKLVAVFPGGFAVNYHLRVRSPLSHLEVFPIAISLSASLRALNELKAEPADLVMLYARDLSENGAYYFGSNRMSGRDILVWLRSNYKVVGFAGRSSYSPTGHGVDFLVPNGAPKPPPQRVDVDGM